MLLLNNIQALLFIIMNKFIIMGNTYYYRCEKLNFGGEKYTK